MAEYVLVRSSTYLTLTAAAGIVWLVAPIGVPIGYRTERRWQTGETREQTEPLLAAGRRSLAVGQVIRKDAVFETPAKILCSTLVALPSCHRENER